MEAQKLITAMNRGSLNPKGKRIPEDLCRFGLVFKIGAFPQCTRLSVATSHNGSRSCAKPDVGWSKEKDNWLTCGRVQPCRVVTSLSTPVFQLIGISISPPPLAINFRPALHKDSEWLQT